ncbi:ABC transporter permease, partial [Candidatus Bipolaricaulota bacterium]
FDSGDFQVRTAAYSDDPLPENGLTMAEVAAIESTLADFPSSWASTLRVETGGMLRSAYGTLGVAVRGIDPLREHLVTDVQTALQQGRFVTGPGEIVLSRKAADDLDVRVGERVVLLAFAEGASTSQSFTAVGIVATGLGALDSTVFVSLDDARSLASWDGATSVVVSIPKGTNRDRAANRLEDALAGRAAVVVQTFFELNPMISLMLSGSTVKLIPFVVMVALLAGFGVANTVFYSVLERTREFGMMTAVGMSGKQLARVILFESIFVSAIGFVTGGAFGYAGLLYLSRVGIHFGSLMGDVGSEFGLPAVLYASTSGIYWIASFSVVVFTGLIAAWYPARRATRLEPVTAIREG